MKNQLARLLFFVAVGLANFGLARADSLSSLGRVVPRSGVIDVAGLAGDTIEEIRVKEGDWVEAGQSLARLSSFAVTTKKIAQLESDLNETKVANARESDVAQAKIAFAEAELKIATERSARVGKAKDSDFVSPDQIDDRALNQQNSALKLSQAREELAKLARTGSLAVRAAEVDLAAAKLQLALAEVCAPSKAQVLKILGRPGNIVGRSELFKLADTSTMLVIAEIYEADVLRVKLGQKAMISSAALPQKLTGSISSISRLIFRNSLERLDPSDTTQSRIIEVTIQMDTPAPLDRLVLLQVDVNIAL